jgi:hypothetical protein
MPVHDEFSGRKSFPLLLIQIGQEPTLQGFRLRHFSAFLWSWHRQSCKESVHFLKAPALLALLAIQKLAYRLFHTSGCIRPDKKLFVLWAWTRISLVGHLFHRRLGYNCNIVASRCPPRNPVTVYKTWYMKVYTVI